MKPTFRILAKSKKTRARVGIIETAHGTIFTPAFVPVGTNASVKSLSPEDLNGAGVPLVFYNTYHLVVHPGVEVIEKLGGLHEFSRRSRPIITDSGGFQVFSLAYGGVADEIKSRGLKKKGSSVIRIDDDGVTFRSYLDGRMIRLTPESSANFQRKLGADLIVAFDELLPYHTSRKYMLKSLQRTHNWEVRSLREHMRDPGYQGMYAVIHGGTDLELRRKSVETLMRNEFFGAAIGGSLGRSVGEMLEVVRKTAEYLETAGRPIHLLGIGDDRTLDEIVAAGIDTFDSSYPTRAARHGILFTSRGRIKIGSGKFKFQRGPVEPECDCWTCKRFSAAYLHHLFKSHELLYYRLATIHNIRFMERRLEEIRRRILGEERD